MNIFWKEPSDVNGIIKNYFVAYSLDQSEPKSNWKNITVFGNKTSTNLLDIINGKRYYVVVQAVTKIGTGHPSEPIVIFMEENSFQVHNTFDKEKSFWTLAEPKFKGKKKKKNFLKL